MFIQTSKTLQCAGGIKKAGVVKGLEATSVKWEKRVLGLITKPSYFMAV